LCRKLRSQEALPPTDEDEGQLRRRADRKGIGKDPARAAPMAMRGGDLTIGNRAFAFLDCIG
jgi:hypothetical protein